MRGFAYLAFIVFAMATGIWLEWAFWGGWRELARRVARIVLTADSDVEMSAETQRRLARLAK